jgi:hypothetical protein
MSGQWRRDAAASRLLTVLQVGRDLRAEVDELELRLDPRHSTGRCQHARRVGIVPAASASRPLDETPGATGGGNIERAVFDASTDLEACDERSARR